MRIPKPLLPIIPVTRFSAAFLLHSALWISNKCRGFGRIKGIAMQQHKCASVVFEMMEARRLLSGSVWQIHGDINKSHPADMISIAPNPADAAQLQATINGKVIATRTASKVKQITINAGAGNDVVQVDLGDNTNIRCKET